MRYTRCMFLTLILFLTIFSISFVGASEYSTYNHNTDSALAMSDGGSIDNNIKTVDLNTVEKDGSSLGKANEEGIDEIESHDCLTYDNETQLLRTNDVEKFGNSNDVKKLGADNVVIGADDLGIFGLSNNLEILGATDGLNTLGASNNVEKLGSINTHTIDVVPAGREERLSGGTLNDVREAILRVSADGGGVVYLQGGRYTGNTNFGNTDISNVLVVGGYNLNDNVYASFGLNGNGGTINFEGTVVNNCNFTRLRSETTLFYCRNTYDENRNPMFRGSMSNVIIDHCQSIAQFIFFRGHGGNAPNTGTTEPGWNGQGYNATNVRFWYCDQTMDTFEDGHGQFVAVLTANIIGCEFINTTSGQHSGAICVSDESEWGGAGYIASKIINCTFINITSKWFAVYLHGRYKSSPHDGLYGYEVVENCQFIHCYSTEGYGGGLGISHDDLQVRNCTFIDCTGGQGSAIMVGGIDKEDGTLGDYAFNGDNTKGNNITIIDCTFKDNVAKAYYCPWNDGTPHDFYSTGYGGAVYIIGNNSKVINSVFENNVGTDGSAINIYGINTTVINSTFINNRALNGTVYIEGANTTITDSKFDYNTATNGAGAYIRGENATVTDSEVNHNKASFDASNPEHSGIGGGFDVLGNHATFINVTSNNNTAYRGGSTFIRGNNSRIENCTLDGNSATLRGGGLNIAGSNCSVNKIDVSGNKAGLMGGALYIVSDSVTITNITADNNTAQRGGAAFINGTNIVIRNGEINNNKATNNGTEDTGLGGGFDILGHDCLVDNVVADSNTAYRGGSVFIRGNNITVQNSHFDNNNATLRGGGINIAGQGCVITNITASNNKAGTEGGAVYVVGNDTKFDRVTSLNNTAERGGSSFIQGNNIIVSNSVLNYNNATLNGGALDVTGNNCTFTNLTASYNRAQFGGAVYVRGDYIKFSNVTSENNTALNGGSSYIHGDNLKVSGGTFNYNNATVVNGDYGLGGAIYVDGDNTLTNTNTFTHNIARNGSAIYTKGLNFTLEHDHFNENQAWSYLLIITPDPQVSYYRTSNVNITVVHVGGDNIINAIHNSAAASEMRLLNVSYTHSRKGQINTDPYNYETPVEGAELSENGTKLYQDDREDFQLIDIEVNYDPARRGVSDFPYTVEGLQTNIYGEVNITLDKSILDVGYYRVYAEHDEDWNYKAINNESWFRVEPYVDLSVNKTADAYEYHIDDTVIWTIVVSNAENGTAATNVTLNDTFPENFNFVSYTASEGTSYDHNTRVWTIGTLANGANVTLTIVSVAKANGTYTNHANVTANETEWNYTNNYDNATVLVLDFPSNKSSNVTNYTYYNSNITYYLTVANIGHDVYEKNITVVDKLPEGIDYIRTVSVTGADVIVNATLSNNNRTVTWVISNINPNTIAVITVLVNAHTVGNVTNNETVILHNGTNWTVNTTDDIRPIVDVSVNKTVDKELYYVGDVVVWTIKVSNAFNGTNATNVTLRDILPSQCTLINYTATKGNYSNGIWTIGFMGNGTNATLTINSRAVTAAPVVINIANVTCNETEWNYTNNVDNATIEINDLTEVNVTKVWNDADNQDGLRPQNVTVILLADGNYYANATLSNATGWNYTFTNLPVYRRNGTLIVYSVDELNVTNYTVNVTSPGNYSFIINNTHVPLNTTVNVTKVWTDNDNHDRVRPQNVTVILLADGNYTANVTLSDANNWTHTFANLPVYRNNGTLIVYSVDELNVTNYTVNVTSPGNYSFIINNTHEIMVNLSINKTVDLPVVYVNDTVVFTINVTNNGPSIATNVTINDIVPSQFRVIDCNDTKYQNNQLVVATLNPGESYAFTITAVARVNGTWTNFANVTCAENNTVVEDNATVEVLVLPPPNKVVSENITVYHANVTYNLTIINDGDYNFTKNVTVYDMLPDGLEFIERVGIYNATILVDTTINSKNNISWVITDIPAHSIAVIMVKVKVNAVGNLTNNETIVYPDGTNMTVNCTIEVLPIVDLSVIKTVDNAAHFLKDVVVWTVTVHNAANGTDATNVVLNDTFPANFTIINWTATSGTFFNTTSGVWTIGTMGNGTNVTLTIYSRAKVNGTFTNEANVTANETEWNYTNNYDNATVIVYDDPHINKTVNNKTVYFHDDVIYNLTVTNVGNVTYNKTVTIIDDLPEGVEYLRTVAIIGNVTVIQNATLSNNNKTITWKLTDIPANTTIVIMVEARATAVGTQINNETIVYPDGSNDTVNATIEVLPIVDLSVIKTVDNATHFLKDVVVWTITVYNAANGTDATNVVLNDTFPADFTVLSFKATEGTTYNATSGVWTIGTMGNGTNVTLTIYSRAKVNGTFTNEANVTANETEWNYTNNYDNATVIVYDDPHINKTVNNDTVYFHDDVIYNLTVTNVGNVTYNQTVTIIDDLPEGVEYLRTVAIIGGATVLQNATLSNNNKTITWKLTDIPANTTIVIMVEARATAVGTQINNETIVYPDGSNDTVNATIEVLPIVDLSVIKTVDNATHFIDDIVVWTITVYNAANGTDATNVTLNDTFPDELTVINWTATPGTTYNVTTGVWTIGTMGNGTNVTLTINSRAKVNGTFTNEANVTCVEKDWNLSNNYDNETVVIYDIPDVNKTVNNTTPNHMDYVLYNITITNIGNVTYIQTLTVVDSLPEGLEYNGTVRIIGADVVQNAVVTGQVVTWKITNITANVPAVIMVRARAVAIGNLTNNATVIAPNGTNKTVNCTIDVKPICDVEVSKSVNKPVIFVDGTVEWTITVVNKGPSVAENVVVNDTVPVGLTIVSASQGGIIDGNNVIWNVGDLVANSPVSLKLVTKADLSTGARTNVVVVNTTTNETNYTNNEANNTTVVYPLCDLEITKAVNATSVYVNDFVEWTITVVNHGPSTAKDVVVKDTLPAGLKVIKATPSVGKFDIKTGTWRIGDMDNTTTVNLVLVTQVVKEGSIKNIVVVRTPTNETNYKNNKADNTTVVKPICDVEITKVVDKYRVYVGDTVVWTIKVKNNGPSTAKNVKVSDLLPKGLRVLDASVTKGSFNMDTYEWTVNSLAKGASATLKLTTKVVRSGFITNPVSVKTTTKETDYTNNNANDTTQGIPVADLELKKYADKEVYKKGDKMYWTIVVTNHGPSTAKDVVVSDVMPSGVKFLSFKASKGSYDPTTGEWDIGELAKGETVTIVIYCNVTAENGTITNTAVVTSSTHDSNPKNNKDTATITVEKTQEPVPPKMHPTGNPIVMVVLSLLAIIGVTIRRKL